jgi:pyruvate carboxylase
VEHTITEQQTSVDLVRTQFELAAGHSLVDLDLTQESIHLLPGFTVQTRISLAPGGDSGGVMTGYREPGGHGVRVDSCGFGGLIPSTSYDPMFAKVIVSSPNPEFEHGVLQRARAALNELFVEGVHTNRKFVAAILDHPKFVSGDVTTSFVTDYRSELDGWVGTPIRSLGDAVTPVPQQIPADDAEPEIVRPGDVLADLSGSVVKVLVEVGDMCQEGDAIAVLTSMKMEMPVLSQTSGTVISICVSQTDLVTPGTVLVRIDPTDLEGRTERAATKPLAPPWASEIEAIHTRRKLALVMGGQAAVDRHHSRG